MDLFCSDNTSLRHDITNSLDIIMIDNTKFPLASETKVIRTVEINILSAIGSNIFPRLDKAFSFLAISPSK